MSHAVSADTKYDSEALFLSGCEEEQDDENNYQPL